MNIQGSAKNAICDLHHVSPANSRREGTLSRAYRSLLAQEAICQKFPMLIHDAVISSVELIFVEQINQARGRKGKNLDKIRVPT